MTKRLAPASDVSLLRGGVWPTAAQQLLLKAALLDGPEALRAWAQWQEAVEIDAIDLASWLLIPLAYVNQKRLGGSGPLLLQARDCHLQYWCSNQKLFHLSAQFLDELRQREIPALVLKGVAVANLYYPDVGCRPMADLDLLVPVDQFVPLAKRLAGEGWRETDGHSLDDFRIDRMPSFGFVREDGFSVDIHCHVLHADCSEGADVDFWAHARSWVFKGSPALTLSAEDQLLHVISHGVRWCDVSPVRWIADAWWVLARTGAGFDWERFIERARFHEINLHIQRGLECMRRITPSAIPADVMERLQALPVSAGSRVRFTIATHPLPRQPFLWRAFCILKAIGQDEAPRPWNFGGIVSLLRFAGEVAVRDRRRILGEGQAWLARLFGKRKA